MSAQDRASCSILAAKLGASRVLGVDIDPDAVRAARDNADLNGVSDRVAVEAGSHERGSGQYDLVIANILAGVIRQLLSQGLATLGRLFVFSGVLEAQADEVMKALDEAGLGLVERKQIADRVCFVCQRKDPLAAGRESAN